MSDYDNGFARAQREYDNQLPPDNELDDCPKCDGEGTIEQSNCCGATILDIDICSKCKEHCDKDKCEHCDGTGVVDMSAERAKAYAEWQERKADEARDESIEKCGSNIDRFIDKHGGEM
jgi:RecJ-like exonuclease